MAAKDEIRHRVSLEGADDVARRLKGIGDVGSDAFKKVKQAADDTKSGLGSLGSEFEGFGSKTEASRATAERLREVIHTLHPVLDTAGLGLGNLGAFAKVAGAGFAAFAAAIVGSVVVGLAKLSDQAATTKKRLDDLSPGAGGRLFAGLQEDAKRLGTDIDKLAPGLQQLIGLRNDLNGGNRNTIFAPGHEPFNLPGGPLGDENLRGANRTVQSLFAAGKADDPAKAAADFFTAVRKAQGLSAEALQGAAAASPGAANKIAQSLPEGFATFQQAIAALNSGRKIGLDELIPNLAKAAPKAEADAASARGVTEAFDGLAASAKRLGEELAGGSGGLAQKIDGISRTIDQITDRYERALHPGEFQPGGSKFIGPVRPGVDDVKPTDLLGRATGFIRSGATGTTPGPFELPQGNPFGVISTFLREALTNPAGFGERQRPETGSNSLAPNADQLAPTIQTGNAAIADAVKTGNDATTSLLGNIWGTLLSILNGSGKQQPVTEPSPLGIRGRFGGLMRRALGGRIDATAGGHIQGPGTPTSDSIPLWGSNKEYMISAKGVEAAGVPLLDMINAGHAVGGLIKRFADGGGVTGPSLRGNLSVSYDPTTGGAYINGQLYLPGDPALNDPDIQAAIARSKADMQAPPGKNRSNFGAAGGYGGGAAYGAAGHAGGYAEGGPVGNFRHRIAAMGFGEGGYINVPHFDVGGRVPDVPSAISGADLGGPGAGMDLAHFGTVNLTTNHGTFPVITHEDTLRHMTTAGVEARTFSTGKKPGWRGGR